MPIAYTRQRFLQIFAGRWGLGLGLALLGAGWCAWKLRPAIAAPPAPRGDVTIARCMVAIKDEARVPALADGPLAEVAAVMGSSVAQGEALASQDPTLPQLKLEIAKIDYEYAQVESGNEYEVQYARTAAQVAEIEYLSAVEANEKLASTIPESEVRRYKLQWQRSYLQIKQAELKQEQARILARGKGASVKTGDTEIRRLQIASPLAGEVVEVLKHTGEWAAAGDPVAHVVNFDTLKVEGFLSIQEHVPADVLQRPVTVRAELASGPVSLPGKIVHVSGLVEGGGNYRVSAEVGNQKQRGQWLLRPGLTASLTIHFEK